MALQDQPTPQAAADPSSSGGAAAEGDYTALPAEAVFFRPPVLEQDLDAVIAAESASYPADEAATPEKLRFRMEHANDQFLLAVRSSTTADGDELLGYACGMLSGASKLTHASMDKHEPEGTMLCIHSVCVREEHRRKGIATRLLKAYLNYVRATTPGLTEARLICKQNLVGLYEAAGFTLLGPSDVVHGKDAWLEMEAKWL